MLRRYELSAAWNQDFETLSGGQQARMQILLLELEGATMLLLDEPPTTSTSRRPKHSRTRSRRSKARCSR